MSALAKFARMLGIGDHQAEDALRSERAARVAVGRRDFLAAGAALATGAVFSRFIPEPAGFWLQNPQVYTFEDIVLRINGQPSPGLATFTYSFDKERSWSGPQAVAGSVVIPGTGATITFPATLSLPKLRRRRA